MKVRRWIALILVLVGVIALATPTNAAVGGNTGFMLVRNDGQLYYYSWNGSQYSENKIGNGGWGQTKLIATVSPDRFVEVTGDRLRTWHLFPEGSGYSARLLDDSTGPGWATMRAITGVGNVRGDGGMEIIGITANGDLMLYLSRGGGYVWEQRLATGYQHVRLIAGLSGPRGSIYENGHWVYVNHVHEDLYECRISNPGNCLRLDSGWQEARLLGPGGTVPGTRNGDSFTSISYKDNGVLQQWYWQYPDYTRGFRDTNWGATRLIG